MKTVLIYLLASTLLLFCAFTQPRFSDVAHATPIASTSTVNSKDKGALVFKQLYTSAEKKQYTELTLADYELLLQQSDGKTVLIKQYGAGKFNQVIRYSKRVQDLNRDSEEYKRISQILAKYE